MKTRLIFGLSMGVALGLSGCGAVDGGDLDAAYVPPEDTAVPVALDTAPVAIDTAPLAEPFVWLSIQDT